MGQRNVPRQGEIYKHFKNKLYQIVAIAIHSETEEEMVVYQALYGKYQIFVRPLEQFMSKVEGYKYRFELMDIEQIQDFDKNQNDTKQVEVNIKEDILKREEQESTEQLVVETALETDDFSEDNNELIQFLDANTCQDKLNILIGLRNRLNDTMLNNMMVSLDIAVSDGTFDEHFEEIKDYLQTRMRFEFNRLR